MNTKTVTKFRICVSNIVHFVCQASDLMGCKNLSFVFKFECLTIGVFTVDSNGCLRDHLKNSLRKLFFVGRVQTGAKGEFKQFQL
jgi:hypothetical protein